jgi:hypothetical protein
MLLLHTKQYNVMMMGVGEGGEGGGGEKKQNNKT